MKQFKWIFSNNILRSYKPFNNKYISRMNSSITKNKETRICFLRPMDPEHATITLKGGINIIGRSPQTRIQDVKCSKRQIELNVFLDEYKIMLKVLGMNPCGINGLMALQNTVAEIEHGDLIELVYGKLQFEVVFKPPPETKKESKDLPKSTAKDEDSNRPDILEAETAECWDSVENNKMLIYTSIGVKASEKIVGYDIDGTIIKTKSGNVFPKSYDDWEILYPQVPPKLKLLHENGYKICFFSNQGGISKGKVNVDEFKKKVKAILKKLDVPVQVFISTTEGIYRKPLPGMWNHLQEEKNSNIKIDLNQSFFVGDAAGRPEYGKGSLKRKKDHSYVDRFFAANIGISFYTPEEHFLGKKTEQWIKPDLVPSELHDRIPLLEPETAKLESNTVEIIIMVGLPGSGKSHFVQEHLKPLRYEVANADILGSISICLKKCERALTSKISCVVDNTNVDVESRKKFIDLAKKHNVSCRCFLMNVTLSHIKHNIAFRQLTDTSHSKINEMVINMMKKKFTMPTLEEGFAEIVKVNIKPKFKEANLENLYKMYLVEK